MKDMNIGQRLKTARKNRNMTLDDAAEVTGVSKAMLGQIERGQSVPSVNTLWKISTGMKVPFSAFLKAQEMNYTIVDLLERDAVSEENGKMRAYTIFAFDPIHSYEIFYIEFDSGCQHNSESHNKGVEEYVFVIQGKLDLILNGEKITLKEKQAIRFEADIPHSYINPYKDMCTVYNTIFYKV